MEKRHSLLKTTTSKSSHCLYTHHAPGTPAPHNGSGHQPFGLDAGDELVRLAITGCKFAAVHDFRERVIAIPVLKHYGWIPQLLSFDKFFELQG